MRSDGTTDYANSYLGRIGKVCEPVFTPLGLNWKSGVALLSGVSAKEIVVSTLGVLYAEEVPATDGEPETATASARNIASGNAGQTDGAEAVIGGADGPTEIRVADLSEETSDGERSLGQRLIASGDFTRASVLAFLAFILLYIPCIATVVAIGAEAGWRWAIASVVYDTAVAWVVAWVIYHAALLF